MQRRRKEQNISLGPVTEDTKQDNNEAIKAQTSVLELENRNRSKEMLELKKERNMSLVIAIILITFLVCTIPAAVIIQLDPEASRFTDVSLK